MTATVALDRILDRTALENRIAALSSKISHATDVLRKLDLVQERHELRLVLATIPVHV